MFKFLVAVAIFLRLVLMPISVHSDLFFINMFPNLLLTNNVTDVSSFIQKNIPQANFSYYPPLTYYLFAIFQYFYHFFSPSFSPWMQKLLELESINFKGQAIDFIKAVPNANIFMDIFLAKTPYLVFDFACVFAIFKYIKNKRNAKNIIILWLFNPALIYSAYLMGQFDLIPAFFVLTGFMLLSKNTKVAIVSLGIAAALKNYALLMIIPIILIYEKAFSRRLRLFILAMLPYALSLVPSFVNFHSSIIYTFFPKVYINYRKPLEGWQLYSQSIKYILLGISYLAVIGLSCFLRIKDKWRFATGISLVCLLLLYALAPRISVHYLLWAVPIIIIYFKNAKIATILILIQAFSLASYKLLAPQLQAGLFAPLDPYYIAKLPTINSIIDKILPYRIISTAGFVIFLLTNLFFSMVILIQLIFRENVKLNQK